MWMEKATTPNPNPGPDPGPIPPGPSPFPSPAPPPPLPPYPAPPNRPPTPQVTGDDLPTIKLHTHINYPDEQDDLSNPQDEVMQKFVTPHTTKAPVIEGDSPGFMGQSCEQARVLHRRRRRG